MRPPLPALVAPALVSALVASSWAMAATPENDAAAAEALFQEARLLMSQGNVAQACPKLAQSHRLDPATGTLLNLAVCHEAEGKLATAWAEFSESLTRARVDGRTDREKLARERMAALEPRLATLTIVVDRAKQPPDLGVQVDGVVIGPAVWGTALFLDPGAHDVRAAAAGKRPWTTRITVTTPGRNLTVQVPPLEDERLVARPAIGTEGVGAAAAPTTEVPRGPWSTRRRLGLGLAGIGVASLAAGTVFGVRAFDRWSDRDSKCPMNMCRAEAVLPAREASAAARISNVAFGVGLAAAAIGAYLVFSPPAEDPPQAVTLTPVIDLTNPGLGVVCGF